MEKFSVEKNPIDAEPIGEKTELFVEAKTEPRMEAPATKETSGVRIKTTPKKTKFSLESTGHEAALRYAPEFLGEGGESIVYEIPGRPGVVVKGSKYAIYDILAHDPASAKADAIAGNETLTAAENKLREDGAVRKELVHFFGREHVPPQKKFLRKVPMTREILDAVESSYQLSYGRRIPKDLREAWSVVTVQRRQELHEREKISANVGNLEHSLIVNGLYRNKDFMEDYEKVSEALLSGDDKDISNDQIANILRTSGMHKMVEQAGKDPAFKDALKDFVERAMDFSETTGEILDIVGKDNVAFTQEDGKWTYKLLDPLYPFEDKLLAKARGKYIMLGEETPAAQESGEDSEWEQIKDRNILFQGINYVRGLNAMAKISGSEKRLEFLPKALMNKTVRATLLMGF